ncbi:minor tail protein [Mycobacterium phage Zetzy]|uniref:Minor tail protein n=1 Tax=Mycobacterium phage Zetzy TaxID=2499071 RepID=A0A3S9UNS5_9CAUD|nr:minor tail protein [Mycobacterium phage Zetzy]AZS12000.1 minor tail protein [Mycobacterium phage Zetzy]
MAATDDTQPLDLSGLFDDEDNDLGLNDLVGISDEEVEAARKKVPEPALVRGGIMAVVGLVAFILGKQIDTTWVEPVMDVYVVAAPLALAWWIRRNVTPVGKHRAS